MKRFRALIFDVDGTLAETEEVHRRTFNDAFAYFGLAWEWDITLYRKLLRVTGGKERIRHFTRLAGGAQPRMSDDDIHELHRFKTERFVQLVAEGACPLRPGVENLIRTAESRKQKLAIATTTSRSNVEALISTALGNDGMSLFVAVVAGDEVHQKKPDPEVYLKILAQLGLARHECLAIEDSRNGLVSALRAGIPTLITRSVYFGDDSFPGALAVVDSLEDIADLDLAMFDTREGS